MDEPDWFFSFYYFAGTQRPVGNSYPHLLTFRALDVPAEINGLILSEKGEEKWKQEEGAWQCLS